MLYDFNGIESIGLTSIIFSSNCLSSSFKARTLASVDRRCATRLLSEQPEPAQPIRTMVSPNPQFVVGLDRVGCARLGTGTHS